MREHGMVRGDEVVDLHERRTGFGLGKHLGLSLVFFVIGIQVRAKSVG